MELNGIIAFTAGLLSFLAPCVLPLVPSYLICISGISIGNTEELNTMKTRGILFGHSIFFVLGFSVVFVFLGISSSAIGRFLVDYQVYISQVGGALLIVLGLFTLDFIRIPFLDKDRIINLKNKPFGFFGSFVMGVAFSVGWTPCIGPALSSILIIASMEHSIWRGAFLLSMYSLGFAVPFLLSALLFQQLLQFLRRFGHIVKYTMRILGILLIIVGILLVTADFYRIAGWLEHVL